MQCEYQPEQYYTRKNGKVNGKKKLNETAVYPDEFNSAVPWPERVFYLYTFCAYPETHAQEHIKKNLRLLPGCRSFCGIKGIS